MQKHFTPNRRRAIGQIATALVGATVLPSVAQTDAKTLNLVVGYPSGGSTDLTARIIGPELAKRLGQTMVIDNVGGAGGTLGAQTVAAAKPDGNTLLMGTNNEMAIHKLICVVVWPLGADANACRHGATRADRRAQHLASTRRAQAPGRRGRHRG